MTQNTMRTFETSSRKLEQFLYLHDIHHIRFYKNQDNMTTWVYPDTEDVQRVVGEFRDIAARRNKRLGIS